MRGKHFTVVQAVFVLPLDGIPSGMKTWRNLAAGKYPDISGKPGIQGIPELLWRNVVFFGVEITHLPRGMYPRVGSSGSGEGYRLGVKTFQGFLYLALNAGILTLYLPAGVLSPVVGNDKLDITLHP